MIQELYRGFNALLLVILSIGLSAFQSVLLKQPAFAWLELDLILLIVVYLSLHRSFLEGCLVVILIGRITELHSSAPSGILVSCYLAVFLSILFTKEMFLVGTSFSSIILALTGGVIWKLVFLLFAQRYGILANAWQSSLEHLFPFLLSLGLFARPSFDFLRRLDYWTKREREADMRGLAEEDF